MKSRDGRQKLREPLSLDAVERITAPLARSSSILVGGQAVFFWLNYFAQTSPEAATLIAIPSKDVDYLGTRQDAERLAKALSGQLAIPSPDDHGPQMARVDAMIDGREVEIDFIRHVLGITEAALRRRAVAVQLRQGAPIIVVMHPIHCLISRAANSVVLRRKSPHSSSQLASTAVLAGAWIALQLKRNRREATRSLREVYEWLRSDINGRDLHRSTGLDGLDIIRRLHDAPEWDRRYRSRTISPMIAEIERRRKIRDRAIARQATKQRRD